MKSTLIAIFSNIFLCFILQGCKNKVYENKAKYEIGINETVEIYYTTNSCCNYCISNNKELKHIELLDDKLIVPEKEGCEGCSHTSAFIFKGIKKGIDTLELKNTAVSMNCDSKDVISETYIIEVKK